MLPRNDESKTDIAVIKSVLGYVQDNIEEIKDTQKQGMETLSKKMDTISSELVAFKEGNARTEMQIKTNTANLLRISTDLVDIDSRIDGIDKKSNLGAGVANAISGLGLIIASIAAWWASLK